MNAANRPFDDIRALILKMPGPDEAAVAAAREREGQLTKPAGSLGRLEEIVGFLAAWQGGPAACRQVRWSPSSPATTASSPRRLGLSRLGDTGDGREFHCRRRRDQPDLQDFRHLAEGLSNSRSTSRPATSREEPAMDERTCAATIAFGMEALAVGAGSAGASAKWASATRRLRPRSIMPSTAASRTTGSAAAPASTTPG